MIISPPFLKGGAGGIKMLPYNKDLKEHSRDLRRNMTEAEKLLWSRIRKKQVKDYQFYRQRIIGNYIVDFYCPKAGLIVELDGGQHYHPEDLKKDTLRDDYMESLGLKILRFSNNEIFGNLDAVMEKICACLNPPLKKGEM